MIALQLIFWISILLIVHTYLLFPLILKILAGKSGLSGEVYREEELPLVSVLISAFNEEDVIEAKVMSVLECNYPAERMEILIGSDASTDRTSEILQRMSLEHSAIKIFIFEQRRGKPEVVNHLAERSNGEVLVITDANVMLEQNALLQMVRYFKQPGIGLVDSRMIHTRLKRDGISVQETFYISREVRIKHRESVLWGAMMGPFGGCYAVRKSLFRPVPFNFLVDDFFINMTVLKLGYRCISNVRAEVYEDVSNNLAEEFRRKQRISAGNFQNLARFASMLVPGRRGVAFCFLSHKVIRWFVPFLVMITLGTSIALGIPVIPGTAAIPDGASYFYAILALLQIFVMGVPVIDHFLRKNHLHAVPLRFVSHFVLMNLALLAGFLKYMSGIRNNVWEPTRRNQV